MINLSNRILKEIYSACLLIILLSTLFSGLISTSSNLDNGSFAYGESNSIGEGIIDGVPSELDDPVFSPFGPEFIVTASEWSSNYYLPSNGDGTFGSKSEVSIDRADGVAIADFDNDGDLDFVMSDATGNRIVLYRNDGGGTFIPISIVSVITNFFSQFRSADFNSDGNIDFTGSTLWNAQPRVYINQGNNTFSSIDLDNSWLDGSVHGVATGDFNRDGIQDIAYLGLYDSTTGKVGLYVGNGNGTFQPAEVVIDLLAVKSGVGGGTSCMVGGDFDSDRNSDLLIGCSYLGSSRGLVYFFKGDGNGGFAYIVGSEVDGATFDINDGTSIGQGALASFDFDKDGALDIVSVNWNGGDLFFHKGNGDGTFNPRTIIESDTVTDSIGIAAPPRIELPSEISIDIKPGSFPNSINLKNRGVIPVAIINDGSIDLSTINISSIRFGPNRAVQVHFSYEDVESDGDLDLILHFRTQDTGIKNGDIEAALTARLIDGRIIAGSDSLRTVP